MPDLKRIENAVLPVLDQEGVELVDLRYIQEGGRWVLRFYLDKAGGITLGDCEYLSNRIGGILDNSGHIQNSYSLEVSSPGLDRVLKKEKDFVRFAGHLVKIRLKTGQGPQGPAGLPPRRHYRGYLKGLESGQVVLEAGESTVSFPIEKIDEARLCPEVQP